MFAQDVAIGKSHDIVLDCAMDWLDCLIGPHGTILNYCWLARLFDESTCFAISGPPLFRVPISSLWVKHEICK